MARFAHAPTLLLTCSREPDAPRQPIAALRQAGWRGAIAVVRPWDRLPLLRPCGLLLAGGVDIHAQHWDRSGLPPWPGPVDPERDAVELALCQQAWARDTPILGLCRGAQLLAVARGGALHRDIPSASGRDAGAHQHGTAHDGSVRHRVTVAPRSRLWRMLGHTAAVVNSRHHQAVREPGDGLVAVAHDPDTLMPDGPLVEAIEARCERRFAVGVQWHPENLVHRSDDAGVAARRVFAAFVHAAARVHADARRSPPHVGVTAADPTPRVQRWPGLTPPRGPAPMVVARLREPAAHDHERGGGSRPTSPADR